MAKRPLPTPEELRQLLRYEPDTGKLFWLERGPEYFTQYSNPRRIMAGWNGAWATKEAGNLNRYGYIMLRIFAAPVGAHRVAWAMVHGAWAVGQIDHINGVRYDNRIANLRQVSHTENQRNMRRSRANTSGYTGVTQCRSSGKWCAQISLKGGKIYLGRFLKKEDAALAVKSKRAELGFSPRHGEEGEDFDKWRAITR